MAVSPTLTRPGPPTAPPIAPAPAAVTQLTKRKQTKTGFADFWTRLKRDRAAIFGLAIVVTAITLAIIGPWIAPFDPTAQRSDLRMAPPGTSGFLLGADHLGRDILSRLLYGGQLSLIVGLVPVLAASTIGVILGLTSGYYGKWVDMAISRFQDVQLAFPAILLAIGIVAALGPGLRNAMIAVIIVAIPSSTRLMRASVIAIKQLEYVSAARACGATDGRIIFRHILPNAVAPLVVYATLELGRMMIFAAGLSFLGLGVQPPTAEWGAMLADGRNVLGLAPHVATIPGLAICTVAVGLNLMGDGIRDAMDPRLRNA
ncbi:MAG: ABC transporter permease [Chloroflexi bacterium]|nr:ABC transporter permease [Chloroflexota bacterium]